jgi:hypothetical protein
VLEHDLRTPENYLGVRLHLLFRDFVPLSSGIFRADHIYYKKHGMYKGRHYDLRRRMMNLMFGLPQTRNQ